MQTLCEPISVVLVCPTCHAPQEQKSPDYLHCACCDRTFSKSNGESWDLRDNEHFVEWFATVAEPDATDLSSEECGSWRVIDNYLISFLIYRGFIPSKGTNKILSDGCGIGADVERLRQRGYDAWGIDPGDGRGKQWKYRACNEHFIHASGTHYLFPTIRSILCSAKGLSNMLD